MLQRWPFAFLNDGSKVFWATGCFVPECNHAQELVLVLFFLAMFAGPWFVGIQKFFHHANMT